MKKLSVLLTNDDGPDSPLLLPFVESLGEQLWCEELRVVIPAQEQSWCAQSVSRHRPLHVRPKSFLGTKSSPGVEGFAVNGTPADCSYLGVYNLYDTKPDLVVSGINFGVNAGLPFIMSSGTVGGAFAACLCGVPSIAVSVHLPMEVFNAGSVQNDTELQRYADQWQGAAKASARVIGDLLATAAWDGSEVINLNVPWEANEETEVVVTEVQQLRFKPLFAERAPMEFVHRIQGFEAVSSEKGEMSEDPAFVIPEDLKTVVENKQISVTALSLGYSSKNSEKLAKGLGIRLHSRSKG